MTGVQTCALPISDAGGLAVGSTIYAPGGIYAGCAGAPPGAAGLADDAAAGSTSGGPGGMYGGCCGATPGEGVCARSVVVTKSESAAMRHALCDEGIFIHPGVAPNKL